MQCIYNRQAPAPSFTVTGSVVLFIVWIDTATEGNCAI